MSKRSFDEFHGIGLDGKPLNDPRYDCGVLVGEFIWPPFSVLDTQNKWWRYRRQQWKSFGIQPEIVNAKRKCFNTSTWTREKNNSGPEEDLSVFDPVVTELAYKWFSPKGGQIIDPFSGASCRGVVASLLGYDYFGIDLSSEQIKANREQGNNICQDNVPIWIHGDALEELDDAPEADFIFSCPPYGSLEKYSDDPKDLSNMDYEQFIDVYSQIIGKACAKLKQDRFACFVVGDFRDRNGNYHHFPGDTIDCFKDSGLELYNQLILVTATGTASMRARKQFVASRKVVLVHQQVLVFLKGDARKATKLITA